jgi:LPXTG-motif cell wall-anchored protein
MKEHKKLYKSGKLWTTATVMTLALGAAMATTTAHADAVPANTTINETQTDNQQLQQGVQKKQHAYQRSQANQVQPNNTGLNNQNNNENQNPQKLADNIQHARKAVKDQQAVVQQGQQAVSETQSSLNNAQTKADQATTAAQQTSDNYAQLSQRWRQETQQRKQYQDELKTKQDAFNKTTGVQTLHSQIDTLRGQLVQLIPDFDDFVKSLKEADHQRYNTLNNQYDQLKDQLRNKQAAAYGDVQDKLNELNKVYPKHPMEWANAGRKSIQANSDKITALQALQDAKISHANDVKKLHDDQPQLQTLQNKLDQLLAQQGQTEQKDNQKYTDLEPDLVVQVNLTAGTYTVDNLPAPTPSADAFLDNGHNQAAALFMTLAWSASHLYPAGTTVAWADPAQVIREAQTPGDHDEYVVLHFPDGTTSAPFLKRHALHVNARPSTATTHTLTIKYVLANGTQVGEQSFSGHEGDTIATSRTQLPAGYDYAGTATDWNGHLTIGSEDNTITVLVAAHQFGDDHHETTPTDQEHTLTVHYIEIIGTQADGTPITRVVGSQTFTGHNGANFSGDQVHVPAGYKLPFGSVTYTIGDHDSELQQPVVSVDTPVDNYHQPSTNPTTDRELNGHNAAGQLPAVAKVVNSQVVDANGHVLAGWKVVNGRVVKSADQPVITREAELTKNNRAKTLPQTGNNENLTAMTLGATALLGMFGLAGLNKKRG